LWGLAHLVVIDCSFSLVLCALCFPSLFCNNDISPLLNEKRARHVFKKNLASKIQKHLSPRYVIKEQSPSPHR
jgi:hypothetical protein